MKIIVLDNSTGVVHIFPFDPSIWKIDKTSHDFDVQDFYDAAAEEFETPLKDSECSYMIVHALNIAVH